MGKRVLTTKGAVMKNLVMQFCSNIPNSVTEFDDKNHRGTVKFIDGNGKQNGSILFYLIDTGFVFDKFAFSANEDFDLSSDSGMFSNISLERVKITYCAKGRCETTTPNNRQHYISGGEISINCNHPSKAIRIFGGDFEGFQFYIFLNSKWLSKMKDFNDSESAPEKLFHVYKDRNEPRIIKADRKMNEIAKEIMEYADESKFDMISVKAMELSILIANNGADASSLERKYYTNTQMEIARKTRDILCEDLSVRYSAKELAQRFGISETSLKSYFRGYFGVGYHEYQNNVRMEKAAELLANTTLKVLEISLKVGFRSQTKFGICFKKYYGVNPLEYRRKTKLTFNQE